MTRIDWLVGLGASLLAGMGSAALGACSSNVEDCSQHPEIGCPGDGGSGGSAGAGGKSGTGGNPGACGAAAVCASVSNCPAPGTACILTSCTTGCCDSTFAPLATPCADSGGTVCDGTGKCVGCLKASDCDTGTVCAVAACDTATHTCSSTDAPLGTACSDGGGTVCNGAGKCAAAHCADGIEDGDESDVDCGGATCPPCGTGQRCATSADCASDVCIVTTTPHVCAAPTCTDGVKNGNETGVDCGGPLCAACPNGQGCATSSDCESSFCTSSQVCSARPDGVPCAGGNDCESGNCVDDGTGSQICCQAACASAYACAISGTTCNTSCAADTACASGAYCTIPAGSSVGACTPKLGTTRPCTSPDQCGSGFCVDSGSGATLCCASACGNAYACDPTTGTCKQSCANSGDCVTGAYCAGTVCVGKKALAQPCLAGGECSSGFCVDDGVGAEVCCATACAGSAACNPADGLCYPTPCLNDADCTASAYCGLTGTCSTKLSPTEACTTGDQCQSGYCVASGVGDDTICCQLACGSNLACNPTTGVCYASCSGDASCVPGTYCSGGACVGQKIAGSVCTAADQCRSGTCAAGVCGP